MRDAPLCLHIAFLARPFRDLAAKPGRRVKSISFGVTHPDLNANEDSRLQTSLERNTVTPSPHSDHASASLWEAAYLHLLARSRNSRTR